MPTSSEEHRRHRRVEFFMVADDRAHVPVWVFKPQDARDAVAGLVVNLSDGGVQVMTASHEALADEAYQMQLLLGEDDDVPRFRGSVRRIWTRDGPGAGQLSGLKFEEDGSSAEDFIRVYQARLPRRQWVRCLLVPASGGPTPAA